MSKDKKIVVADRIVFSNVDFKVIAKDCDYGTIEPKFHKEVEIKYCYQGQFSVLINTDVFVLNEGDIAVINPYEIHENPKIAGGNGKYYLLLFDLDALFNGQTFHVDIVKDLLSQKKKFNNIIHESALIRQLIEQIVKEIAEKRPHYQILVQSMVEQLFLLLVREGLSGNEESEKSERLKLKEIIIPSLSKIHTDYTQKLTLEELADVCHMSKWNYCRTFKKVIGMTPIQYLISYRIDVAETLLYNTQMSCEQVSETCGFDDVCYFYRCYKKQKGISPNKARKRKN